MQHLALFRIKDTSFDYTKYSLDDVFFSIDITMSLQASKSVAVTQYAVLDGTTRIDTVSRAPGNLTFQGKIGEIHHAPSTRNFIKSFGSKGRAELQLSLLEALRDQAIVVDVITENKTYRNYIIEAVNSGVSTFGIMDINITMREFLTFGDEIDVTSDDRENLPQEPMSSLTLEGFKLGNITNDTSLIRQTVKLITNSSLSVPYIITFGPTSINPDVLLNGFMFEPSKVNQTSVNGVPKYNYVGPIALAKVNAYAGLSGYVTGNIKIKIEIDQILKNKYLTTPEKQELESNDEVVIEEGVFNTKITLYEKSAGEDRVKYSTINRDLIVPPLFSHVINGINPLTTASTRSSDIITSYASINAYEMGLNFLRKCSQDTYRVAPNLLKHSGLGYLYNASHVVRTATNVLSTNIVTNALNQTYVYIHPDALPYIRDEYERVLADKPFMKGKKIVWWD